ncbi:MAG: acyltransferase family protein [Christensenellales bacterium]
MEGTMLERPQRTRNHLFDLIKTICILMVVVTHISWTGEERKFFVFPIIIDMAVPIFLIISAYLRENKIASFGFKKFISIKYSLISFVSLMVAYVIIAGIEMGVSARLVAVGKSSGFAYLNSFEGFFNWFIRGLSGPGSYYVPIMVQLIFYFPILHLFFCKKPEIGIVFCAIINLGYELLVYYTNMEAATYRLLIFRYTLLIGLGIYLAKVKRNKVDDIVAAILTVVGLAYIILNAYVVKIPLFQAWKSTSMFCAPFAYGVMYFLMKWFSNVRYHKFYVFGKASYHIYLTQMVFYYFGWNALFKQKLVSVPAPYCRILEAIIAVIICFVAGYVLYLVDTTIRKLLRISHK